MSYIKIWYKRHYPAVVMQKETYFCEECLFGEIALEMLVMM
jgi:hypothetical protein